MVASSNPAILYESLILLILPAEYYGFFPILLQRLRGPSDRP